VTKVLLVDDEAIFVEVLALRLRARGIAASTATTAKEALRKVEEESYDVVVLDLMMPDMDGLKVLNILKTTNPNLPVIVFTADFAPERLKEAVELGALDVIPKPTDLRILTRTIEKAMTSKT